MEALALRIAGETANTALVDLTRPIAEAQIDLRRIRAHKLRRIANAQSDPYYQPPLSRDEMCQTMNILKNDNVMGPGLLQIQRPIEFKSSEQIVVLGEFAHEFEKLDRHERRILSRRRFAIRAFDANRASMDWRSSDVDA